MQLRLHLSSLGGPQPRDLGGPEDKCLLKSRRSPSPPSLLYFYTLFLILEIRISLFLLFFFFSSMKRENCEKEEKSVVFLVSRFSASLLAPIYFSLSRGASATRLARERKF